MFDSITSRLPKRVDRALQRRSFEYFRRRRFLEYRARIREDLEPLIIYQMGKVGSSTIVETLANHCPQYAVYQVHVLTRDWISNVEGQYRKASKDLGRPTIDQHVLASRYLLERFDRERSGKRWKVISIVRDPVARNISAFFQAFPIYFSQEVAKEAAKHGGRSISGLDVDRLIGLFLDQFGEDRHHLPLEWFQLHMQPAFGLDVYDSPFDRDRGYQTYSNEQCELLVLRMEDLRNTLQPALRDFLGVEIPVLTSANVSADKEYADSYREFMERMVLPPSYLDTLYNSKYARYFYTEEEIAGFRRRWQKPSP
jgi:hypothetical protein